MQTIVSHNLYNHESHVVTKKILVKKGHAIHTIRLRTGTVCSNYVVLNGQTVVLKGRINMGNILLKTLDYIEKHNLHIETQHHVEFYFTMRPHTSRAERCACLLCLGGASIKANDYQKPDTYVHLKIVKVKIDVV